MERNGMIRNRLCPLFLFGVAWVLGLTGTSDAQQVLTSFGASNVIQTTADVAVDPVSGRGYAFYEGTGGATLVEIGLSGGIYQVLRSRTFNVGSSHDIEVDHAAGAIFLEFDHQTYSLPLNDWTQPLAGPFGGSYYRCSVRSSLGLDRIRHRAYESGAFVTSGTCTGNGTQGCENAIPIVTYDATNPFSVIPIGNLAPPACMPEVLSLTTDDSTGSVYALYRERGETSPRFARLSISGSSLALDTTSAIPLRGTINQSPELIAIDPALQRAVVVTNHRPSQNVYLIDLVTMQILSEASPGNCYYSYAAIATDSVRHIAWVADSLNSKLRGMSFETGKMVAESEICGGPSAIDIDSTTGVAFVVGNRAGDLMVVDLLAAQVAGSGCASSGFLSFTWKAEPWNSTTTIRLLTPAPTPPTVPAYSWTLADTAGGCPGGYPTGPSTATTQTVLVTRSTPGVYRMNSNASTFCNGTFGAGSISENIGFGAASGPFGTAVDPAYSFRGQRLAITGGDFDCALLCRTGLQVWMDCQDCDPGSAMIQATIPSSASCSAGYVEALVPPLAAISPQQIRLRNGSFIPEGKIDPGTTVRGTSLQTSYSTNKASDVALDQTTGRILVSESLSLGTAGRFFVIDPSSATVSPVSLPSGVGGVGLGARDIEVNPSTRQAVILTNSQPRLLTYGLDTGTLSSPFGYSSCTGNSSLALNLASNRAVHSDGCSRSVDATAATVVDLATGLTSETIWYSSLLAHVTTVNSVAVDSVHNKIYAAVKLSDSSNSALIEIAGTPLAQTREVVLSGPIAGFPDLLAVDGQRQVAVVAHATTNSLSIVDLVTMQVRGVIQNLPERPSGVEIDTLSNTAWVASRIGNMVSVIDLRGLKILETGYAGCTAVGVAVDQTRGRAFATNLDGSTTTVFSLTSAPNTGTAPTCP
jgi:hypothetical protein